MVRETDFNLPDFDLRMGSLTLALNQRPGDDETQTEHTQNQANPICLHISSSALDAYESNSSENPSYASEERWISKTDHGIRDRMFKKAFQRGRSEVHGVMNK
jgi:hypothetical protein